jgi:hypothetical protein
MTMHKLHRSVAVSLALVLALGSTPLLTGCFGGNPIQNIVKNATGGKVDLGGAEIPKNFPKGDIPLFDGKVVFGGSATSDGSTVWNVSVRVKDAGSFADIQSDLEAKGFTVPEGGKVTTDDGGTLFAGNDKYGVAVVVGKDSTGFIANYTVTKDKSD